jgi:hypothetical protein
MVAVDETARPPMVTADARARKSRLEIAMRKSFNR